MLKQNTITVPRLSDPRLLLLCFFAILVTYAIAFPGYSRAFDQLLTSILTCITLDFLLTWWLQDKIIFPMSGFITSMGVFLLTDTDYVSLFFLCGSMSILSKHVIQYKGRHIFNPNNFGVLMLAWALPMYVTSVPVRWGGNMYVSMVLFCLGMTIAYRVNRHWLSVSYFLSFIAGAGVRSMLVNDKILNVMAPLYGPATQLFVFYMITDPKTSPHSRKRQILFGVMIGLIDNIFRYNKIRLPNLIALFITCIVFWLINVFMSEKEHSQPWVTKEIPINV